MVLFFATFSTLNLVSQLLPIYLLGVSADADVLVIILSISTAITGIAISTANSLFLNIRNSELGEINLFYFAMIFVVINVISFFLYVSADCFLEAAVGSLETYPIYLLLLLTYATALFGFLSGVYQRIGLLDRFYIFGSIGTLLSIYLIYRSPHQLDFFVWCYVVKFSLVALISLTYLCLKRATIGMSFSFKSASGENMKNAVSILVSGVLSKGMAPFEKTLLAILSDGWASVLHVMSSVFLTIGKYIDSNYIYKNYRKRSELFVKVFSFNKKYVYTILVCWLLMASIIVFSIDFSAFDADLMKVLMSAVIVTYFLLPQFYSVLMNTVLNQVEFESGNHFYIAKITIYLALFGYGTKIFASAIESTGLLLLFLSIPSMIYVLAISCRHDRANLKYFSTHE